MSGTIIGICGQFSGETSRKFPGSVRKCSEICLRLFECDIFCKTYVHSMMSCLFLLFCVFLCFIMFSGALMVMHMYTHAYMLLFLAVSCFVSCFLFFFRGVKKSEPLGKHVSTFVNTPPQAGRRKKARNTGNHST